MLSKVISTIERIVKNIIWEGSKINHLVKRELVSKSLKNDGLRFGDLKNQNLALLAKWGWRFHHESDSLWCRVVQSIHGKDQFYWHTAGKFGVSLWSSWISISKAWFQVG